MCTAFERVRKLEIDNDEEQGERGMIELSAGENGAPKRSLRLRPSRERPTEILFWSGEHILLGAVE